MHLLQAPPWSVLKSGFGWRSETIALADSSVPTQILTRSLPLGLKIAYVPKGPAISWNDAPAAVWMRWPRPPASRA